MKLIKEAVRKYYKWDSPNVTIVGSPTNNNGVFSNFSASNYLLLPGKFTQNGEPWEIVLALEDISGNWILSNGEWGENTYCTGVGFACYNGLLSLRIGLGANNSQHLLSVSIPTGKKYIKASWDTTTYRLFMSDTPTFSDTPDDYWVSSQNADQTRLFNNTGLGMKVNGTSDTNAFGGKIHLKECYIKIGGANWWQGYTVAEGTENDYDWYEDVDVLKAVRETVSGVSIYNAIKF